MREKKIERDHSSLCVGAGIGFWVKRSGPLPADEDFKLGVGFGLQV